MRVETVKARVEEIREAAGDPERAHSEEYRLWEAVLVAISNMGGDAGELAEAALATTGIEFDRWCA